MLSILGDPHGCQHVLVRIAPEELARFGVEAREELALAVEVELALAHHRAAAVDGLRLLMMPENLLRLGIDGQEVLAEPEVIVLDLPPWPAGPADAVTLERLVRPFLRPHESV